MKNSGFYIPLLLFSLLTFGCTGKSEGQVNIGSTPVDTSTIISGIDTPWEVLWGPDNYLWFTERQGTVSRLNPATGDRTVILTIPDVFEYGEGGLLGMALHPDFSQQPYVYLVYNYTSGPLIKERLVRYSWNGAVLSGQEILIDGITANSYHNGSRLLFGPDGKLYMSTGDAGNSNNSQNINSLAGKILRINPDGSVPQDNPFQGRYVWATGLRNSQGLAFSANGTLYGSDHGPDTDDELNLLEAGRNYGWPAVAGFCNLPDEITFCAENNVREPLAAWTPTLAVAGIGYYNHPDIPEWQNSVLMSTLKAGKLVSLKLNNDGTAVTGQAEWFVNHYGRLRDICVSPDGRVFLAVSNRDGRGTPRQGDDRIVGIRATGPTGSTGPGIKPGLIRMAPNPAEKETTVYLDRLQGPAEYSIYSQQGRLLQKGPVNGTVLNLNVAFLAPGFYILKVSGNKVPATLPFVVR